MDKRNVNFQGYKVKKFINLNGLLLIFFLGGCVVSKHKQDILIQEKKTQVVKKVPEKDNVKLLNSMPDWCKNPKITIVSIQVCGIAESTNIQTSRTRSELDGRKQLARRFTTNINQKINENVSKNLSTIKSGTVAITKFDVQRSTILKRKTIVINNKYLTFTLIVYPL